MLTGSTYEEVQNPDLLRDGYGPDQANNPNAPEHDDEHSLEELIGERGDLGALMSADMAQIPALLQKIRERYDPFLEHQRIQWRVNALRRRGIAHIRPQLDEDGRWFVWKSPAVRASESRSLNYMADLLRKMAAMLFADPPAAEVVPPSGDDEDEERAIKATRVLSDLHGEHALHTPFKARTAFDRSSSFASCFAVYRTDPKGGARLPIRVQAGHDPRSGRAATTLDEALDDPMSGGPWPAYRPRYVAADGALTDDVDLAARRFSPRITLRLLTGNNVYLFPHTAEWIGDAHAAMTVEYVTVGEARKEAGEALEEWLRTGEKRQKLLRARTDHDEDVLGPGQRKADLDVTEGDEALVLRCEYWHEQCFDYAEGAHIVTFGDCVCTTREPWTAEVLGREIRRLIPISQFKQLGEGRPGPYGVATAEVLGPGNEIHAEAFATYLEVLDRVRNRKTFVPTISPVDPATYNNPAYRYIPVAPGTEPRDENVPDIPNVAVEVFRTVQAALEAKISLGQTAQGLEASNVDSGRHAWAIVQQVHAQMSELLTNIERGFVRCGRIEMQLVVCDYTLEQQLRYMGEGGEWAVETWLGSDFVDTTDVKLKPGTLTMLTAAQKEQEALQYAQLGILKPHELRDFLRANAGGRVGLEDDPHVQRIRGQLARWKKGPPRGWQPPAAPTVTTFGLLGEPVEQPVLVGGVPAEAPPDPLLTEIWMPSPADMLPDVAPMRLYELARAAATPFYFRCHPEWRRSLDMELARMQSALVQQVPAPDPTLEPDTSDPREAPDTPGTIGGPRAVA